MALRVLLADESTTIKKVMQLALQDFAVEVKAVHSGLDVLEVARSFQPDIVFADVLLPKRNGYDVCADLKSDPGLKAIPCVLMWSSFMDLDEKAYLNARASGKLEKPFDVESLRGLILELVPTTQTQRLAHFLRFPAAVAEPLETEEAGKKAAASRQTSTTVAPQTDPSGAVHTRIEPVAKPNPAPQFGAESFADPLAGLPPLMSKGKMPSLGGAADDTPDLGTQGWSMESFEGLKDLASETFQQAEETAAHTNIQTTVHATALAEMPAPNALTSEFGSDFASEFANDFNNAFGDDDDEVEEPVRITKLGGGTHAQEIAKAEATHAATRTEIRIDPNLASQTDSKSEEVGGDPWAHQDLARFKLDIPEGDLHSDEISIVFDMDDIEAPKNQDFLLNAQKNGNAPVKEGRTSARIKIPKEFSPEGTSTQIRQQTTTTIQRPPAEDHLPNPALDLQDEDAGPLELESTPGPTPALAPEERYQPIAEIRHADGEMISQFEHSEDERPDLRLDETGPRTVVGNTGAFEQTQIGASLPQLNLDQLESIVRAQSQDIIEALVRRIVPEIATQLIKEELERLMNET
ncbi:MAG: response regulator [Bdellovibrionaceae bacterium]|nr:response regulator [Pseudobdellovibrionaceae bacterium]